MRPASAFRHVLAQGFIEGTETRSVDFAHLGQMLCEKAAAQKFGERRLRELVGVQVGRLLHLAQALDGGGGRDNPADAQAGKSDFGEAVDVNDEVRAIEVFERRDALFAIVQARVDVVFDDRPLDSGWPVPEFCGARPAASKCPSDFGNPA